MRKSGEQVVTIFTELPEFREIVRSVIPADVQDHFWRNCLRVEGRQQYFDEDCRAPISANEARMVVDSLRSNPEVRTSLNYWLSTVSVVTMTLETQIIEADETLAVLDSYISSHD